MRESRAPTTTTPPLAAPRYRGHPLHKFVDQCRSNVDCNTKGRQMPVHYGSAALNFVTISTPLSTQVPQAAGIGLAYKLAKQDNVCVCYFAEGAASEGDFHAGLNFASVLDVPVLFIVRNNGWAISTPSVEGFGGDGIVPRCQGYGMAGARVDGNDALAIFNVRRAPGRVHSTARARSPHKSISALSQLDSRRRWRRASSIASRRARR